MGLINWQIKPEYIADKKAEVEFMLARKQQVSISIHKDHMKLVQMGVDVVVNAKLTITQKSREVIVDNEKFEYKNHAGDLAIEYDEVTNNTKVIEKEYSITIDEGSGKMHICNDVGDGQSIIQGIIGGYIAKEKNRTSPSGAHFNHQVKQEIGQLRRALFSGFVYLENLPVDLMGKPVDHIEGEEQIELELSDKEKEKAKIFKEIVKKAPENQEEREESFEQVKPKQEDVLELPTLDVLKNTKKGQLKPPRGSSRTQRNVWWGSLRGLYPDCFDTGGNWLGWIDMVDAKPLMEVASTNDSKDKAVDEAVPGLLVAVGADNRMTNMADKKIRQGFILGVLIKGRGYSTLSTPTSIGQEEGSALVICNKPRTGKFMLAGLERNSSFAKKVKGYDLVDVMTFHQKYFTEDSLVYYVCNAVTALQELGTQEKDIEDIKQNSA